MGFQHQAVARDPGPGISLEIQSAAAKYQHACALEKEHLAVMAQLNLLADWTEEVHLSVLEARRCIRDAQLARATFRGVVRGYVVQLRGTREPLSAVLRRVRAIVQQLEYAGAITADDGWLEADVVEWAIEDYENPA
ncbi:MAG TPA: hypothetical protein VI259_04085 [Gemmatimonadaceae bacterium]